MNPGAGTVIADRLSCNGLYDPYIGTGGHQPRGFDELMSLYKKYTVIGSKIKVTFGSVGSGATNDSVLYGIAVRPTSDTVETQYNDYLEQGNCIYQISDINVKNTPVSMTWSPKRFNGITKVMSDEGYRGTDALNPANGANYHIFIGAADQATDPNAYTAICLINYVVVFSEPKDITQS